MANKAKRYVRARVVSESSDYPSKAFMPDMEMNINTQSHDKATLNRKQLGEHVAKLISNDRNETHGDPHIQFDCAQKLKVVMRNGYIAAGRRSKLNPTSTESIEMICTKLSRLVSGSNLQDAWLDIAGYALIAAEKAEKPL